MPLWNDPFYHQKTILNWFTLVIYIYIYIYAFSRRYYPNYTVHSITVFTFYQLSQISAGLCCFVLTWTPKMPKIMKKAQQMTTMFPIGFRDDISVSTTSFSPGALLITLKIQPENRCLTSLEVLSWFLLQDFSIWKSRGNSTQKLLSQEKQTNILQN